MLLIILVAMMGPVATRLLICSVMLAASSVCLAQRNALPTAPPPDKKPCDVLTKSDAEAILGQPAELRDNNAYQCWYVEIGWTNKPPKNKQVRPSVFTNASPKPTDVADKWKNMADYPMPTLPQAKTVPTASLRGGKTFAEAVPITASQFLQEVKEVALTVVSSPSLAKYIPPAELERYVTDLLAFYNVSVRPNAPVSLRVTIDELLSDFTKTTTSYDRYGPMSPTTENFHAHTVAVSLDFFVRTAVWRNGAFHPLVVAPVTTIYFNDVTGARDARKLFVGDETPGDMRTAITDLLTNAFKDVATDTTADGTPWTVSGWSDKDRAAANAAFIKAMSASTAVEKRPTEGLDSAQAGLESAAAG